MDIQLHGIDFQLLSRRGLFWPAQRTLFVADTHFGKEATFRRHGIGVPVGSTDATVNSITAMLHETSARRLVILGDMFHAKSSLSLDVRESLEAFFATHQSVEFRLVRGNHDTHVGRLPSAWPIDVFDPGIQIERVALGHHPDGVPEGCDLLLCGHVHPAIRMASRSDSLGKLSCFWFSCGCLVLPAIGDFTGTHVVRLRGDDQAWIVAEDSVVEYRWRQQVG